MLFHPLDDEILYMFSPDILLLGTALAMDAAVVTFAIGLLGFKLSKAKKWERGMLLALLFGLFQFFMLWLGSYFGFLFSYSAYGYLFHFVVAGAFVMIGIKFFQESLEEEKENLKWSLAPMLMLALATSIDALAAGLSFGTLPDAIFVAAEVGLITSLTCSVFYIFSQFFHQIPERWLLRMSACIFLLMGGRIIWEYFARGSL